MRKYLSVLSLALAASCAQAPSKVTIAPQEQIRRDNEAGKHLYKTFETQISLKNDKEVAIYLRKIASKLVEADPVLKDSPIGAFILGDRDPLWKNAGLPGIRIYLSLGFLKAVEYETALAASIALELAHVKERHAITHLEQARSDLPGGRVDFFGPRGILHFSDKERYKAIRTAVGLLYGANYDPRGLIQLWDRYRADSESSPYPAPALERYRNETYREIANRVPLRNPIVRSDRFLKFQKRVRKL